MSEGSSLALYIMIGAIIFGVFMLIVAMYNTYLKPHSDKTFGMAFDTADKVGSEALSAYASISE